MDSSTSPIHKYRLSKDEIADLKPVVLKDPSEGNKKRKSIDSEGIIESEQLSVKKTGHGKRNTKVNEPASESFDASIKHTVSKSTLNNKAKLEAAQANKPDPIGQPEIWADKRQPLCQTITQFKSYQGGTYTNDKKAYGLLCDGETGQRDKFGDEVIISRVGGGLTLGKDGEMVLKKDQDSQSRPLTYAEAFKTSMEEKIPILVIFGQGNKSSPSKMPHRYNVLGYFHVTYVWLEMLGGIKVWKIRLEKIDKSTKSWWSPVVPEGTISTGPALVPASVKVRECHTCHQASKEVFTAGWACLTGKCKEFFKELKAYDKDNTLKYNEAFFEEQNKWTGGEVPPIASAAPTAESMQSTGASGLEARFAQGIVCQQCGCCTRRLKWTHWECENKDCKTIYKVPQAQLSIHQLPCEEPDARKKAELFKNPITMEESVCGDYVVRTYNIPGKDGKIIGFIRHFHSCQKINEQENGPNHIFEELQKAQLNLSRNPVRQAGASGEVVTSHWAVNWGAPYKFAVKQLSTPFKQAPTAILLALKRLSWAGEYSVGEKLVPFNELLSIGYFEASMMNYHDDGEKELGETVASLSLGCSATMFWRPKNLDENGKTIKGVRKECLKILLQHGDIMIMHGAKIQQMYDHKVEPSGLIRFALTCRTICPEMVLEKDREYYAEAAELPASFNYIYDGSEKV